LGSPVVSVGSFDPNPGYVASPAVPFHMQPKILVSESGDVLIDSGVPDQPIQLLSRHALTQFLRFPRRQQLRLIIGPAAHALRPFFNDGTKFRCENLAPITLLLSLPNGFSIRFVYHHEPNSAGHQRGSLASAECVTVEDIKPSPAIGIHEHADIIKYAVRECLPVIEQQQVSK